MRWSVLFVMSALVVGAGGWVVFSHQNRVMVLKEPPASLAAWYKPQNKRQVWLHTMFKLRREMLAIEIYAKDQDSASLQNWAAKLNKDYLKIAEMAPEWANRVDLVTMAALQTSVDENRFDDVANDVAKLRKNCQSCHADFRAVTAALYRAPDFSEMKIDADTSYKAHMGAMSNQVNRINIASIDDQTDAALAAFADLTSSMKQLGATCATCHKSEPQTYPSAEMSDAMATLGQSLNGGTLKEKGAALGAVAVMACATCHGTHRLSYDAKQLFKDTMSLRDLLKHSF